MIISRLTTKAQTTIPLAVRVALDVAPGDELGYLIEDGRVVLTKVVAPAPVYRLEDLMADMDPVALREAFDWGPDRGREIVD